MLVLIIRSIWQLLRLPILTFLVILQPVVGLVFGGLALLGVLMSFLFKLSGAAPHFPFLMMLVISVSFGLALIAYEALIRHVSRPFRDGKVANSRDYSGIARTPN